MHVLMPARLLHQRFPEPIIIFLEEAALLKNGRTGRIGNAAMNNAKWLAFRVGIKNVENVVHAHEGSRWMGSMWFGEYLQSDQ